VTSEPTAIVDSYSPSERSASANLITDFYDTWLPHGVARCVEDPSPRLDPHCFSPGFVLPELSDDTRRFFAVATARWRQLGEYGNHRLVMLDLTENPGTHTTKTFASLLIVARAVEHIRRTGERVLIFTPTSANKGIALRDAVLRALDAGLVTPDQLRVATLAPASCQAKLRASRLSSDPGLRRRNPLLLYTGRDAESVKAIGREFVRRHSAALCRAGIRLWFTLDLANYSVADSARAFFEWTVDPIEAAGRPRLHAHAVSSAFGLLGYHQGRAVLEAAGAADSALRPASLLVQHLGTPDMVLHLRNDSFERALLPRYRAAADGLLRQDLDPHFPSCTYNADEVLDPTFYTHRPATSPQMNEIIKRHGGAGIVVSLYECLQRYAHVRSLLAGSGRTLPTDPRDLREWSVVMALTGVFNAIDRGLVEPGRDVVVHGSGWYGADDYAALGLDAVTPVDDADGIAAAVATAD
jgi:hypothetical protein